MLLHAALAEATDVEAHPDRRAWHRAQAAAGPDEAVAEELERSAARAQARGGIAASAAFLESAATLTPEPAERVRRLFAAAHAKRDAGALEDALHLLTAAETGTDHRRSRRRRPSTCAATSRSTSAASAMPRACSAARPGAWSRSIPSSPARRTSRRWARRSGPLTWSTPGALVEAAEAARAAPPAPAPAGPVDVVLDALALRLGEGHAAAAPELKRALATVLAVEAPAADLGQWLWLTGARATGMIALELWDVDAWHTLSSRQVQVARDSGAFVQLQFALNFFARSVMASGELAAAAVLVEEERAIGQAMGNPAIGYVDLMLAAWRGEERLASQLIERMTQAASARGLGRMVDIATYGRAVLYNGIGRYDVACDAARAAFEHRDHVGHGQFVVGELAEAASRTGDRPLARGRARVGVGPHAGDAHRLGVGDRGPGPRPAGRGRRRGARVPRVDRVPRSARGCGWSSRAGTCCTASGCAARPAGWTRASSCAPRTSCSPRWERDGFAERARHELLATGETVRKRTDDTRDDLTPQEEHIARLAVSGRTNPEIGAELFISPRTVEWHLKKVFTKLGITSRKGLRDALPARDGAVVPA